MSLALDKKSVSVFLILFVILGILFFFAVEPASANTGAFDQVDGVSNSRNTEGAIYSDLNKLVNIIMAVGGFWILACLIFAGIRLSSAQSNPQARTQGFIGLGMAAIGGWIVVQARTIAGWIGGFGATS